MRGWGLWRMEMKAGLRHQWSGGNIGKLGRTADQFLRISGGAQQTCFIGFQMFVSIPKMVLGSLSSTRVLFYSRNSESNDHAEPERTTARVGLIN